MMIFKLRRDSRADWATKNPILAAGEPGQETDTGRFKLGNGRFTWTELDYFIPSVEILSLIDAAVESAVPNGGGVSQVELDLHVSSLTPHPVYDDGPSLMLLYENAKV